MTSSLQTYHEKRDFGKTPEPKGKVSRKKGNLYMVQKHDATRLHFDLRLELDGVLKSWAVTKGPSLDPSVKRLAVRTEDHPVDYGDFEGVIPSGYGKGTVMLWDTGSWEAQEDPHEGLKKGSLKITLKGERLKGGFALVRMKSKKGEKRENWLLIKERDGTQNEDLDPVAEWTDSVKTGRDFDGIEENGPTLKEAQTGTKRKKDSEKLSAKSSPKPAGKSAASLPAFIEPQLATLGEEPPEGEDWLHEIKYDGYRLIACWAKGSAKLYTRSGKDWTGKYPVIADAFAALPGSGVIDGELVAINDQGHSDFGALQAAMKSGDRASLVYYAFDLLKDGRKDWRKQKQHARKDALATLLDGVGDPIRYSDHVVGKGDDVIGKACQMGLEGIISKRADAKYQSKRTRSWIKSKCTGNDEFVIGGYRKSDKKGRPFASLLLGDYVDGDLVYRGRVGTGFSEDLMADLSARMKTLERKTPPFAGMPPDAKRGAVFLTPDLVGQIAYTEITSDGHLRHPSFLGLREDKPANEVKSEKEKMKEVEPAKSSASGSSKSSGNTVAGVKLSSPDRVLYPDQGVTKHDLAEYFAEIAEHMLPHIKDRPVSLVRCPSGRTGSCFFQKHHNAGTPDHMAAVTIIEKDGDKGDYLLLGTQKALVSAAQIGALELHIWGARKDIIEKPDRIVFDLDPDEGKAFEDVKKAAQDIRDLLAAADLQSFAMLTGGKGVHVVVPVERRHDWATVKGFASGFARRLAQEDPSRFTATMSKAKRKGKIFIDWLRNERGATAICPYSTRSRTNAPVATPLTWDELARAASGADYTIANIRQRLARLKSDPWGDYASVRQSLHKGLLDELLG
ncbi:DNA ligase D [Aquisalinus flavus]|uniref:DNA ligase (ATP) n=1 Tax=Aquisalinus flavus TaxID=1526572 RepID=A0A8J2V2J3_9PROT|nr:DNA ligase D [Aquisalinus flavus]MBD0427446.1 DNA ligase D [Aquisalinus flavus]UNE47247.1 DNA ligase D [Aquisalinus flavus]GGD01079.1 ATP-dependent DNA ligase [Aquisalinus flavus]